VNLRAALPLIAGLLLSSRVASPEGAPDAGVKRESLPLLGPIPEERSRPPTLAEWTAALDIGGIPPRRPLTMGAAPGSAPAPPRSSECKLRRVREWIRFRCVADKLIGAELLAGTASEVSYSNMSDACPPAVAADDQADPYRDQTMVCNARVEIVFPIRRGDRRFFQILRQGPNEWSGVIGRFATVEIRSVLEVAWVAEEPLPVVVTAQYGP